MGILIELKNPNKAFEGLEVHLKTRRYRCYKCNKTLSDMSYMSPAYATLQEEEKELCIPSIKMDSFYINYAKQKVAILGDLTYTEFGIVLTR